MNSRGNLLNGYGLSFWTVGDINHGFGTSVGDNEIEAIVLMSVCHQLLCKFSWTLCALQTFRYIS